jgi:hypothetical protein
MDTIANFGAANRDAEPDSYTVTDGYHAATGTGRRSDQRSHAHSRCG